MDIASEEGKPIMRPMFFDYHTDPVCYELEDQYMFGEDILFAPITVQGQRDRRVYLPEGSWQEVNTGKVYAGQTWVDCHAEVKEFIALVKEGSQVGSVFTDCRCMTKTV